MKDILAEKEKIKDKKTQDDNDGSQEISVNSSAQKEASQSQVMDSQSENTSQISKTRGNFTFKVSNSLILTKKWYLLLKIFLIYNTGAIKKGILTKDKITKVKKTQGDNVESQEISVNSSAQKEASQSQLMDSQPQDTSQISKTQGNFTFKISKSLILIKKIIFIIKNIFNLKIQV